MNYIAHIQSPLTKQDCNLFIKALETKGNEATAYIWIQWYFDFKNNPQNIITEVQKERMAEAIEQNKLRIFKAIKS